MIAGLLTLMPKTRDMADSRATYLDANGQGLDDSGATYLDAYDQGHGR